MTDWRLWADKRAEATVFLKRSFWRPLRHTMEIFHVLPLVAVVVLFVLLATDGQLREIYISNLEEPTNSMMASSIRIVAALIAITLLSAVLYEAHHALSTVRINVFSGRSGSKVGYDLHRLQNAAGFVLAFLPWLGLTAGLFGARNFVVARYCQLLTVAGVEPNALKTMHPLIEANGIEIALTLLALGAAATCFVSIDDRHRIAQFAVACIAPAFAALLFLLFADRLNSDTWESLPIWIYIAVAVATLGYFLIYYRLYHHRGVFWLSRPFIRTGIGFRKRRRLRLALWAFLPWVGLAVYFFVAEGFVPAAEASSSCFADLFSTDAPAPGRWAIFPVAMCCTITIGLLVGQFLLQLDASRRRRIVLAIICGLALAAVLLSVNNDADLIVSVYRFIGPLATVSLELLFLISTFAALAVLSQNSGFPALTLIVLTIVVCIMVPRYAVWTASALGVAYLLFAVAAFISGRKWAGFAMLLLIVVGIINLLQLTQGPLITQNPPPEKTGTTESSGLNAYTARTAYLCWLDQKGVPATPTVEQVRVCGKRPKTQPAMNGPYPAFIVAAEGGGIYAASAAATFLAKLEKQEPGFTRHIFAISGVSGGSIGAAVFQALAHATEIERRAVKDDGAKAREKFPAGRKEECTRQPADKPEADLPGRIKRIMQDDHFSPVVGSIFPEIFNVPMKRPDALRASFEYSTSAQDTAAAGRHLCAPFLEHWSADAAVPALVLNSTWVEMGFRVAFAPFRLHDLDESLYSFLDPLMPDESCQNKNDPVPCISVMTAAGASARFPGMMPPFSVKLGPKGPKEKRWNFVDGGYSDNSGATTALDIYRVLSKIFPKEVVDLRIVLITSSRPQPNLADQSINGTVFLDTLAPIDAILKVREDLANDAVGRACTEIYPTSLLPDGENKGCVDHAGDREEGKLQIVEIQDQTYGLPLGWKISQTSFAVISWMLGQPSDCRVKESGGVLPQRPASNNDNPNAQLTKEILRRNGCVSDLLVDLVKTSSVASGNALGR